MVTKKGRKISGGKYIKSRKKKRNEKTGQERLVRLGEEKRKKRKILGKNKKINLLQGQIINVKIKDKTHKLKITNVVETPSNRFFARQNKITKGTIVDTEKGKARVTNRPSQESNINGVLVE